jgi:hypothetical protein
MSARPPPGPREPVSTRAEPGEAAGWGVWLAWTWVLVLVAAAVAELGGLDDLRLALDVQRHFSPKH